MIVGYTFDGVSFPAAPFAKMIEELLNYNEGILERNRVEQYYEFNNN